MARIKFGNFIVDARGKIAGNIYARNGSGAYAKGYVKPTNPQSSAQSQQRAYLAQLSQAWRELTDEQRQSWNDAAPNWPSVNSVGDPVQYSGEQLFISLNLQIITGGFTSNIPSLLAAPSKVQMPTFTGLAVTRALGPPNALNMSFATDENWDETVQSLRVFASQQVSTGVTSPKTPRYRLIGSYQPADPTANTDLEGDYEAVFGTITPGNRIFFKVFAVSIETGQNYLVGITKASTTAA